MFSSVGTITNVNLNVNLNGAVGPNLLRGLNQVPHSAPGYAGVNPDFGQGFAYGAASANFLNPGGLGSLRPALGNGQGGSQSDGYIQGLEDALQQVRGPKSKPDEERIRALLQTARQNRQTTPGAASSPFPGHPGQAFATNFQGGGACSAGQANPQQGSYQQGYIQGVEAALGQIHGKKSKPDEERVRALLTQAKQTPAAAAGQRPTNTLPTFQLTAFMAATPSLFSGCRTGAGQLF